jgi:cytochrome c biogenesis protein CcdA
MLIAAVLCLCAAAGIGVAGLWTLARPHTGDPARQLLQALAPAQLAAAVMLAAGGAVALSANAATGLLVLILCVVGAVATVAAGSWHIAKVGARAMAVEKTLEKANRSDAGCGGVCASCTFSCR